MEKVFTSKVKESCEATLSAYVGLTVYVHLTGIFIDKGEQCHITMFDITARKQAEQALLDSERHYRALVEGIPGIVYSFSNKRGGMFYSDQVNSILGYSPEQLYAQPMLWYNSIHPDERYSVDQLIRDATTCKPFCIEYRIRDALGNWHWFEDRSTGYHFDGNDAIVEGLVLDITERKRAEEALRESDKSLRASLEEKDVLLKEVHHRVKNNLAAIIGLLDLQSGVLDDEPAKAALEELSNRIRSMSLVHEQLYQSKDLSQIDFQDYLDRLIAHLGSSYQRSADIHISVAAKGVKMGLDNAIPCGLLITELVTNAFKYAFPADMSRPETGGCEIVVSIQWDGTAYTLVVADNGVGLPVGLDWTKTKTLGLVLVKMLGQRQLQGEIEVDCTGGTTFRLRFAPPIARISE
jgi:PAS domain S-box-containing protein